VTAEITEEHNTKSSEVEKYTQKTVQSVKWLLTYLQQQAGSRIWLITFLNKIITYGMWLTNACIKRSEMELSDKLAVENSLNWNVIG